MRMRLRYPRRWKEEERFGKHPLVAFIWGSSGFEGVLQGMTAPVSDYGGRESREALFFYLQNGERVIEDAQIGSKFVHLLICMNVSR